MPDINSFNKLSEKLISSDSFRNKMQLFYQSYDKRLSEGKAQFSNLTLAKERAAALKKQVLDDLEKYLIRFESNFKKNGGKLIWSVDADSAVNAVLEIMQRHKVLSAVKSKSMISEEIGINKVLQSAGIDIIETDVGEFIQQEADEPPFHIVMPAMHQSREEIGEILKIKSEDLAPEKIVKYIRESLRAKYKTADAGITGANFLLPDIGGIVIVENEANARLTAAMPNVHIVITSIEKLIPSINDLELFLSLLASHATNQQLTVYNSIYTGPARPEEKSGPEYTYLILLDNGRTNVLSRSAEQREALACIRCGACLNVCPVFRQAGGHAYQHTYPGPIGAVIEPLQKGLAVSGYLSDASTLCGRCNEVCPVNIDLHKHLLQNRKESFEAGLQDQFSKKSFWKFWRMAIMNRKLMNLPGSAMKNFMFRQFFAKAWGKERVLPVFPKKSFNELWRERNKITD